MWRKFTIANFRGLKRIQLDPLGRINLIAGKNNTGKTAVLEAVQLHSLPREISLPFAISERGSLLGHTPSLVLPRGHDLDSARWLSYDRISDPGIEFASEEEDGTIRIVSIWVLDAEAARSRYPELAERFKGQAFQHYWESEQPRLIICAKESGKTYYGVACTEGLSGKLGGLSVSGTAPWAGPSVFIGSNGRPQEDDIKDFSELEATYRQDEITPFLQFVEPRLKRLVLVNLGNTPVIHGDIGLKRLLPMRLMGEGVRRLLSILLAILTAEGGNVLIDEIENGLHYSVIKDIWKAIGSAAKKAAVQVFATTHNWECIRWAHEAFVDDETYPLCLHRLDRIRGEVSVVGYGREQIESSLGNAVEMR